MTEWCGLETIAVFQIPCFYHSSILQCVQCVLPFSWWLLIILLRCSAFPHPATSAVPSVFMTLSADGSRLFFKCSPDVNQTIEHRQETEVVRQPQRALQCTSTSPRGSLCALGHRFILCVYSDDVWLCYFPGVTLDTEENWCSQVNRLQQLLDKLECQVWHSYLESEDSVFG